MLVSCRICRGTHELEALEPAFKKPDAFVEIPAAERPHRTLDSKDACAVRNSDDTGRRYFVRVLMPFTVSGLMEPYSWGIWIEISEQHFERVRELWDDPVQELEPAFPGRIANKIHLYPDSLSLAGLVSLTGPAHVPHFHITSPESHHLFQAQRSHVSPAEALEWILPVYHPQALIDWVLESQTSPPRASPWWRFWA